MVKRSPIETYCEKKISTLQKNAIGMIDYIDISSVDSTKKKIISFQTMNAKDAPSRAKQLLKKDDILVSTVRPNLNAVAVVESETDNLMVGSTGYCVLRCKDNMVFRYLFNFCQSQYFIDDMSSQATGASYPAVSTAIVRSSLIPSYPVDEQRRIASELDKITDLIDKRKEQLEKLDALVKARFIELFGDPVGNTRNLPQKTLPELGEFGRGVSKHRPRNAPELLGGKYPLIQTGEVANAGLYITSYENTYSELGFKQSKMWDSGTLCITIAANIAKTAILTFDACFPDSVVGFNANELTNNIFIHYWFSFFQSILEAQAPESAQKNINLKVLSELEVIVPPIEEQMKFVSFVEQTDKSKLEVQKSLEKLELLKKALMQKYFG